MTEKWKPPKKREYVYRKSLYDLFDVFLDIARSSGGDIGLFNSRMTNLQQSKEYNEYITTIAAQMVEPLARRNFNSWRKAARHQTKSRYVYHLLMQELSTGINADIREQVQRNAGLIRTLPKDVAQKVNKQVHLQTFRGLRASEIAGIIERYTLEYSHASADLIARTEVSKTGTALTQSRCDNLGINWYVWRTSMDGNRVRETHRRMEGVLVRWDNPPSPEALLNKKDHGRYHAGCIWNCRCYAEPVIDINDLAFPVKAYVNGEIERVSKKQLERMM